MVQDITALTYVYFGFLMICFWLLYKYSELLHLDWVIMLIWFIIFPSYAVFLQSNGWDIMIYFGGFLLIEFIALMQLLENVHKNQIRKKRY